MSIRVPVTLVIEMNDEQQADYAHYAELPEPVRARDVVNDVRRFARHAVESAFDRTAGGAQVSIKGRQ